MQNSIKSFTSGITIIETLVVLAIVAVVSGLGFFIGIDFYKMYALNSERDNLVSVLRRARSLSVNNFNQSAHGVYIELNRYTIFQGNSYAGRQAAYDQVFNVSPSVAIGGLQEIVFSQLSGDASASTTIVLNNNRSSRLISTNYEGRINW